MTTIGMDVELNGSTTQRRPVSRRTRTLFYITTILYWFCLYSYVPTLTPYVEAIGGSLTMAGLIIGSYGFAQMIIRIPIGVWSDRLGARKVFIIIGLLLAILSSLGLAATQNLWLTLLFRALAGLAAGCWVAFTVLYAGYYPATEAPKAMGIISFYTSVAQMAAGALGGAAAQAYGWHAPFYLGAAGGVLGLLFALRIAEGAAVPRRPDQAPTIRGLLAVGREWPLLSVSLLAVLAQSITFTTIFGFTPLYAVHIGATKGTLGLLTLLTIFPNAIAGYLSGAVVAKKIGHRNTAALGFGVAALGTLAIPLVTSVPLLLLTQEFNGFGQGLAMPILMGLSIRAIAPERRATAMGFFQAIYSLGMFGGPAIVGAASQHIGLAGGFVGIAILALFSGFLSLRWLSGTASV
ncbi:MAG: MFS transporter [Bacilli bacterium]